MKKITLDINPIFGALTRPAMTAGVPFEYHGLNLMLSVASFIVLNNLLYGLVFLPIHAFGWVVCRYDNQFFSLASKAVFMPSMPNNKTWGVRVYEPW